MKKVIITLISFLVLAYMPTASFAKKTIYIGNQTSSEPSGPRRGAEIDFLTVDVDQESCELIITLTDDVQNLELYLTKNGVTYEEDELDGVSGQTMIYNLENYETGEYTLTIEVDNVIISMISVILEE